MLYDADIREPLFDFLETEYGKLRILEEKNMGSSRADIVMVINGAVVGIEIKSDADSYQRLSGQVKDYDRYFDMNIAAIGSRHAMHIDEHIPKYWGIITIDEINGKPDFYFFRKPQKNPKLKYEKKLQIMWRPELAVLQELNAMPKYKEKSKDFVIKKIAERIPEKISEDIINAQISELLFERDYTTIRNEIREYRKKNR